MDKGYVKHVINETLEMFPGHCVSDADKDRIAEHFSKIELSDKMEKSPVIVQMIQSVVIVKMMIAGEESTRGE